MMGTMRVFFALVAVLAGFYLAVLAVVLVALRVVESRFGRRPA